MNFELLCYVSFTFTFDSATIVMNKRTVIIVKLLKIALVCIKLKKKNYLYYSLEKY